MADHIVGNRSSSADTKNRLKNRFSSVFSNGLCRQGLTWWAHQRWNLGTADQEADDPGGKSMSIPTNGSLNTH
jgi:hypothetical protein